jgi:hypothetical protein
VASAAGARASPGGGACGARPPSIGPQPTAGSPDGSVRALGSRARPPREGRRAPTTACSAKASASPACCMNSVGIVPPLPDRPQDWHHPLLNRPPQAGTRSRGPGGPPVGVPRWPLSTTPRTCTACCSSRCSWTTFGARRRRATGRSPAPRFGCKGSGFGLSPIDRRRLQWEIERSEQAQARGRRRQVARPPQDDPAGPPDLARMPGSPDTAG